MIRSLANIFVAVKEGIPVSRIFRISITTSIVFALSIALDAQGLGTKNLIEKLGYRPNSKLLIIHGDDLGVAHSVDMASEKALQEGWITSASEWCPVLGFPRSQLSHANIQNWT